MKKLLRLLLPFTLSFTLWAQGEEWMPDELLGTNCAGNVPVLVNFSQVVIGTNAPAGTDTNTFIIGDAGLTYQATPTPHLRLDNAALALTDDLHVGWGHALYIDLYGFGDEEQSWLRLDGSGITRTFTGIATNGICILAMDAEENLMTGRALWVTNTIYATNFVGSGAGLTNVDAATLGGGTADSLAVATADYAETAAGITAGAGGEPFLSPVGVPSEGSGLLIVAAGTTLTNDTWFVGTNGAATFSGVLAGTNAVIAATVGATPDDVIVPGGYETNDVVTTRVYSYTVLSTGEKFYSATYAETDPITVDTNTFSSVWSWTAVDGASGYRLVRDTNSVGFDMYHDVVGTNAFLDTGTNSEWTLGSTVTPTSAFVGVSNSAAGVTVAGGASFYAPLFSVPSNTYPCDLVGTIKWDAGYIYVCTATNT